MTNAIKYNSCIESNTSFSPSSLSLNCKVLAKNMKPWETLLLFYGSARFIHILNVCFDYNYDTYLCLGSATSDGVIKMLLVNPNLCGGVVACFLDNTVRGCFFLISQYFIDNALIER